MIERYGPGGARVRDRQLHKSSSINHGQEAEINGDNTVKRPWLNSG